MFGNENQKENGKKFEKLPPHRIDLKIDKALNFRGFNFAKRIEGEYIQMSIDTPNEKTGVKRPKEKNFSKENIVAKYGKDALKDDGRINLDFVRQRELEDKDVLSVSLKNTNYGSDKSSWVHEEPQLLVKKSNGKNAKFGVDAKPFYGYLTSIKRDYRKVAKNDGGYFVIDELQMYFCNYKNENYQFKLRFAETDGDDNAVTFDVQNLLNSLANEKKLGLLQITNFAKDTHYLENPKSPAGKKDIVSAKKLKDDFGKDLYILKDGAEVLNSELVLAKYKNYEVKAKRKFGLNIANNPEFKYVAGTETNLFDAFVEKDENGKYHQKWKSSHKYHGENLVLGSYYETITTKGVTKEILVPNGDAQQKFYLDIIKNDIEPLIELSKKEYSIYDEKSGKYVVRGKKEADPTETNDDEVVAKKSEDSIPVELEDEADDQDLPF